MSDRGIGSIDSNIGLAALQKFMAGKLKISMFSWTMVFIRTLHEKISYVYIIWFVTMRDSVLRYDIVTGYA